jgi:hypothetical protein
MQVRFPKNYNPNDEELAKMSKEDLIRLRDVSRVAKRENETRLIDSQTELSKLDERISHSKSEKDKTTAQVVRGDTLKQVQKYTEKIKFYSDREERAIKRLEVLSKAQTEKTA